MRSATEKAPDSQVILTIEVDQERVERALNQAYRQVVNRVNIPGFRRGKAPRAIVERYVGRSTLLREALEPLLDEVYKEAIQAEGLHPISQPQIEMVEVEPLSFKIVVSVRPTIELGDYRALRFSLPEVSVQESQVDEVLERVQRDQATWAVVERPAQIGDRLLVDVADGQNQENVEIPLIEPQEGEVLGPGVIEALVGVTAGETRTVNVHYPDDYRDKDLAGRSVSYRITAHAVKEPEYPLLDDDLAATVGDFADLAALRTHIRELLLTDAQRQARLGVERQMVDALMAGATAEAPASLIESELDDLVADFEKRLQQQGFTLDHYLKTMKKTVDDQRAEWRDTARERVRRSIVLGEFAKKEGLQVDSAEVDQETERLVSERVDQADEVRQALSRPERREQIAGGILSTKIANRLLAIATGADESTN